MKRIEKKLRSAGGESLVETLVSILVISFSCLTLFFAIMTSARINRDTEKTNDRFRSELIAAESATGDTAAGTVTIHSDGLGDPFSREIDVSYTGGGKKLTSYRLAP